MFRILTFCLSSDAFFLNLHRLRQWTQFDPRFWPLSIKLLIGRALDVNKNEPKNDI